MITEIATVLGRIFRVAAEECDQIVSEARAERRDWIDQNASALGRRRHIAAVRQRLAAGDAGAAMVGRRALLSEAAHAAELVTISKRTPKSEQKPAQSGPEALRAKLGLVHGGAR
jgi:hypothetical protein